MLIIKNWFFYLAKRFFYPAVNLYEAFVASHSSTLESAATFTEAKN